MPVKQDLAADAGANISPSEISSLIASSGLGHSLDQSGAQTPLTLWEFCHTASPSLEYPRR